jgi:transposase-like protein
VGLVTSDVHTGLTTAISAALPGASWQRCHSHYAANLMTVNATASVLAVGESHAALGIRPT